MSILRTFILSDTHGYHKNIDIPNNIDLIIHAGDFTRSYNMKKEFFDFINWYSNIPVKYKILVAGNHDGFIFENKSFAKEYMKEKDIIYLEDSSVIIEGIKFYGTPWVPTFYDWFFMKDDLELSYIFNSIDKDTNVLISHGPPYSVLDKNRMGQKCGSKSLMNKISKLSDLKYSIFGHIHEDRGSLEREGVYYINASFMSNKDYIKIDIEG
jgi:Icc-related predicted phosphoesterase